MLISYILIFMKHLEAFLIILIRKKYARFDLELVAIDIHFT
jgi:hypothetical protein